jgi:hypothetical protein
MTVPPNPANQQSDPSESSGGGPVVETAAGLKALTGLFAVVASDVAIALAAIIGIAYVSSHGSSSATTVSILTAAFTSISTMTTAYFGIRSMSNTAQSSIANANANP